MSPIFLDSDILIDIFAQRQPFYADSALVLTLVETQHVVGCTSSLIFANLYYVLRKLQSRDAAIRYLRKLSTLVTVLAVDARSVDFALHSGFSDFEDAIQYHTAAQHQIAYLITRNIADYQSVDHANITICTPTEYLSLWKAARNTHDEPSVAKKRA